MVRIALCDDEANEVSYIATLIDSYKASRNQDILYTTFDATTTLLASITAGHAFDMIILNTCMSTTPTANFTKQLGTLAPSSKIVFLTASDQFSTDVFCTQATNYLLKPITPAILFLILDDFFEQIHAETKQSLFIPTKDSPKNIELSKLIYCEIGNKSMRYYLTSDNTLESTRNIVSQQQQLLSHDNFIKPISPFIINMDYIDYIHHTKIVLSNQKIITITKDMHTKINKSYIDYYAKGGL